jgi:DNA ligase (NAD+)
MTKILKLPTLLKEQQALYVKAKTAYDNGDATLMSDTLFDKLEKAISTAAPSWKPLHQTGTLPDKKTKKALAHFMPSLHKRYSTTTDIDKACGAAKKFVVMAKLDGSSLLLEYTNGKPVSLSTRGNGTIGGDISFHIKNLKLPTITKARGTYHFRCEAVMDEKLFQKKWAKEFDNSRNCVNGLLNRREPHPAFSDIAIVVLGCFGHTLDAGFGLAYDLDLEFVENKIASINPTNLVGLLEQFRSTSRYTMDGLVVAPANWVMRYASADKPKDIWAFKLNDEGNAAVVEVKRIVWQLSGRGRFIPKIEIEPTQMDGVMVKYATVHNAQWMVDRGVGPGAKLKVLRSGGVIPKIVGVVKKGTFQPPKDDYVQQGVHFVISKKGSENAELSNTMNVRNLDRFMGAMGIEFIARKTLEKFVGVFPTPRSYIRAWHSGKLGKLFVAGGLGDKQSEKIVREFGRVFDDPVPLRKIMAALQVFPVGIGERKLAMIEAHGISMDELTLRMSAQRAERELVEVPGFDKISAKLIADKLDVWKEMYLRIQPRLRLDGSLPKVQKVVAVKGPLNGERVSFTGYRDAGHEAAVTKAGGEVVSFGAKTTILLYKEGGKSSSKLDTARARGVKVMTFNKLNIG